ncbi:hypothetical protein [Glutamicibacter ardleyensis]|uniref:hypothetical protein n=1 Tax=Glutamicibacter ardleyensis TaxID=225894 RepID=UPI003FD4F834
MVYQPNRVPKGQSTGGQYSQGRKTESSVSLMGSNRGQQIRSTQRLEDHLGSMSRQEFSRHVRLLQKSSVFARYNPHPEPDEDGIVEPDVVQSANEEDERLEHVCHEIEKLQTESRSNSPMDDHRPSLTSYEVDGLAQKYDLHPYAIKDLARNGTGISTQPITGSSDAVAKYLKTGKARAAYSQLSRAGADLSFVPLEHDHQPGVMHFGHGFNRRFTAEIDDNGRMNFGYDGQGESTSYLDADSRNPHELINTYYEAVDRGLADSISPSSVMRGQFIPETGDFIAKRKNDNAKFSYDVETGDTRSISGHDLPGESMEYLASRAYYHPMTVARNVQKFPNANTLSNPYQTKGKLDN